MLWDFAHDVYAAIFTGLASLAMTSWLMAGTIILSVPTWLLIAVAFIGGIMALTLLSTRHVCADGKVRLGWHILAGKAASLSLLLTFLAVPGGFAAALLWFVIL